MQNEVRIIRSERRRNTISATLEGGVLVLRIPARMSRQEEQLWVDRMRRRLLGKRRKPPTDATLELRAQRLNRLYFNGELPRFGIRWSEQETSTRWGSCTTTTGAIRLSPELLKFPEYVLDYVIVHELAHLLVPDHSERFWALVRRYPQSERAIGFLEGVVAARSLQPLS
jgi:predicted metal-dependent hydrolase